MITSVEHQAAAAAGFHGVKTVGSDFRVFYYLEDEHGNTIYNKRGERICVEVFEVFSKSRQASTWHIKNYVTDKSGFCYGCYNPTLISGGRLIDPSKILEATPENLTSLLNDVVRLFNA